MVDDPAGSPATTAERPDEATLRLERALCATPELVWRALTDEAQLAAWFWPASLLVTVTARPTPGDTFRIEGRSRDANQPYQMAVGGRYDVVRRPDRLVFSWGWDDDTAETLVTIELSATDDGTRLTLTHERFPDATSRDDHVIGWSDCLDRLPAHLRSSTRSTPSAPPVAT